MRERHELHGFTRMKTLKYHNREGQEWVVRDAVRMPHAPGFWLGTRHDGQVVIVHEHRCVEATSPQPSPHSANAERENEAKSEATDGHE